MATLVEYRHLRRMAQQRERRLEQAGIKTPGPSFPKPSEVKNLNQEMKRLERWMNNPRNTVKGAKAEQARAEQERAAREVEKEARREAARLRKNERERERYRKQQEAKGKTVTPRQKLTEEERQERRRESARKYRERKKEETRASVESLEKLLHEMESSSSPRVAAQGSRLLDMYQQLREQGITVKNFEELKKWEAYFNERNRDQDRKIYKYKNWIEELEAKVGKTASKITGDDVDRVLKDFEEWKASDAALAQEFERERQPNEYTPDMMGNLMDLFMHIL